MSNGIRGFNVDRSGMAWECRTNADVAELVDALDLGSSAERRGGSSPFIRTKIAVFEARTVASASRSGRARAGCAMKNAQLCDCRRQCPDGCRKGSLGELCLTRAQSEGSNALAARATLRRELKNPPSCDKRRHKNDGIGRSASGKRGRKLKEQTLTGYHAARRNIPPGIRLESGAWYGPYAPDARHGRFWDANGRGRCDPFEMTKV